MNFNEEKLTNYLKNKPIIHVIFLIILIFTLINSVSAINYNDTYHNAINIQSKGYEHNIHSDLTNDNIQNIFDNSKDGDTIYFNDKYYNDISIVVNKKLNIISTKNSVIHTSNSVSTKAKEMGIENSFGFYFTNLASGSLIKGLAITGNSDYGIMVEGGTNITILNNVVSGGKVAGIKIHNSDNNNIKDNTIKNAYDGLILENTKNNNVLNNQIVNNEVSGLRLEGNTSYNTIMYNNISGNVINIYANSKTNKDAITKNTLMYARKSSNIYTTDDNAGAAICFAENYKTERRQQMIFEYNSIGSNAQWDAKSTMDHPAVDIGSNWYFDNDGNYGLGHICPMVFGGALSGDDFKHLTMGFSKTGDGIVGQLFEGNNAVGAGSFTIDNINIDGKDYGSVKVGVDGRFNIDLHDVPVGTKVTVTINGYKFNVTLGESQYPPPSEDTNKTTDNNKKKSELKTNKAQTTTTTSKTTTQEKSKIASNETQKTSSGGIDHKGTSKGNGIGLGNYSTSGTNLGEISGEKTGASSPESTSSNVHAYELSQKEVGSAAKNSQFLAIIGVLFIVTLIILGYKRKNNGDYL